MLEGRPLTSHALAWSCDGELAIATENSLHILFPQYPRPAPSAGAPSSGDTTAQTSTTSSSAAAPQEALFQFSLSLQATGIFVPLAAVNAQICALEGIRLPPPEGRKEGLLGDERTAESRPVTGQGGSVSQVVRLEWSPNGLGANMRPVLTAMTTNGSLVTVGDHIDPSSQSTVTTSGQRSRSTKTCKVLWGLGAGLPIPAEDHQGAYRTVDDRIKSFSWAREILPGRGLVAYMTDDQDVVIMSVQYFHRKDSDAATNMITSDTTIWQTREVARFEATGPHEVSSPSSHESSIAAILRLKDEILSI